MYGEHAEEVVTGIMSWSKPLQLQAQWDIIIARDKLGDCVGACPLIRGDQYAGDYVRQQLVSFIERVLALMGSGRDPC